MKKLAKVKIPRTSLWIAFKIEKLGRVEKSENSQTDEDRKDHKEEKLCKSIIKILARHSRERHAILAAVGERRRSTRPVHC